MSLVICTHPECQTTAGCKCRVVVINGTTDATWSWRLRQEPTVTHGNTLRTAEQVKK